LRFIIDFVEFMFGIEGSLLG